MSEGPQDTIRDLLIDGRPVTYGIVQPGPDIAPDGVPLIRGKDYSSGTVQTEGLYHVLPEIDRPYTRSKVKEGDILFSIVGYLGQVAVVPPELEGANITQTTARISISPKKANPRFIFQYLQSDLTKTQVRRFEKGSAQPGLNLSDVERLPVAFKRCIPRQQKIARILQTVDRAMEKTEALIEKYQQIKAGLMHDLFTRGLWTQEELDRGDHQGTPAEATAKPGQLRPTRQDAPHLYQETPIGWIPKAWDCPQLSTLCAHEITYGIVQAGPHIDNGIPYIRTGDMSGDSIDADSLLRTSPRIAASFKRSEIRSGEIVCAIRATVGKVLTVPEELDGANLTQGTARISPRSDVNSQYVLWCFRSAAVQRDIQLSIKGTTFNEITLGDLRQVNFPIPMEKEEQGAVGDRLNACETRLQKEKNKLTKLQKQKSGLMHDLLTGEVPVTPDPEEASDV